MSSSTTTDVIKSIQSLITKIKARLKSNPSLSIFTIVSTLFLSRYIYRKYSDKYINNLPPGPIGLPFFGISFGKLIPILRKKYYRSEILHATYGSNIIYYVLGSTPYVTIMSPDIARFVLSHKNALNRPKPAPGAGGVSIDAFVNINGKQWEERRRLAQSVMIRMATSSTMNKIIHQFLKETVWPILDKKIKKGGQGVAIWEKPRELMSFLTFDTIFYLNFGRTISIDDPLTKKLADLVDRGARVDSSTLNFLPILRNFEYFTKEFDDLRQERYDLYSKLIQQRRDQYYDANKDKPQSYIDYLLQEAEQNKSMTLSEMQSDLALMFNAGQDTTASSLEFCYAYLCKYPDLQNKIRKELQDLFGVEPDFDNINIMSKYNDLHNLKAFMHEILRISSIVPVGVLRHAGDDIIIPKEILNIKCNEWSQKNVTRDIRIPGGSTIVYLSDKMHHTKYYNSKWKAFGDDVVMENWLDDEGKFVKNKDQFFVFGHGRRDCVGQELAKKEILITLGYMLLKYKMRFAHKMYAEYPENAKIRKAATRGVIIMKPIPIKLEYV